MVKLFSHSKVSYFEPVFVVDQEIFWLQLAMHDSLFVTVSYPLTEIARKMLDCILEGSRVKTEVLLVSYPLEEVEIHAFHDNV